jgi:ferric-dicitrate binding protein FerR (iron transport regulator)
MPQQRIYELIARQLSGEATPAELEELQNYLREHGEDQYVHDILSTYWSQHPDLLQEEEETDEEERFQRILQATTPEPVTIPHITEDNSPRVFPLRRWLSYAAAVIVLAGSAFFIYRYTTGRQLNAPTIASNNTMSEVVARPGSRSKLVLPDGTQVWLNAESRITYHNNFNKTLREVTLEGEAFFDVTHNAAKPFIVHTSGINIKVLGTAFNVKSYASDETIEATLLRGSIEVVKQNDPTAPKVILRPNEKLVFNKKDLLDTAGNKAPVAATVQPAISITRLPADIPDSVIKETSWRYNKLDFNGDSFEELAEKMDRWYDVHITINNERLKRRRLKGSFEKETIIQALEALKLSEKFEYEMEGKEVVIR